MTHEEFLALRPRGIGGSDIAAIVGLHPTRTAFDVWASKLGYLDEQADNPRMRWGRLLERPIAEEYARLTGTRVEVNNETKLKDGKIWTLDARVYDHEGRFSKGLEIKNAGFDQVKHWGDLGTDEIPPHYFAQVQYYEELESIDQFDVAVLVGGNDLRVYTVPRDREIGSVLVTEAERFWRDHVLPRVAPEMGTSQSSKEYLMKVFPQNNGVMRPADEIEVGLIQQYRQARAMHSEASQIKELLENELKQRIGPDDGLVFDGGKVTWKRIEATEVKAFTKQAYRRFDFRESGKKAGSVSMAAQLEAGA